MRILWIKISFLLFFLGILTRLFYWQIVRAQYLQAQAEGQHFTNTKVGALRGKIYFSDGSILASINPSYDIFGQPKILTQEQKKKTSLKIAKILAEEEQDPEDLAKDFTNKLSQDLYWVPLKKHISLEKKKSD